MRNIHWLLALWGICAVIHLNAKTTWIIVSVCLSVRCDGEWTGRRCQNRAELSDDFFGDQGTLVCC